MSSGWPSWTSRLAQRCLATAPLECAEICVRALGRLPSAELWATSSLLSIMALARYRDDDLDAANDTAGRALAMKRGSATSPASPPASPSSASWPAIRDAMTGRRCCSEQRPRCGSRPAPGTPGLAFLEDLHRKTVRAALDSLGEAVYASLRKAGEVMPLDEAITLASQLDTHPRAMPWSAEVPPVGPLTGREAQIAALVASGLSNREIAERVTVSKRTVDAHVDHIFTKLRISSRIQLTNWLRDRIPSHRVPAAVLLPLDRLEQRLEVTLPEAE